MNKEGSGRKILNPPSQDNPKAGSQKQRANQSKYGINFLKSPRLLPPYWACVNAKFQTILDKFITCDTWGYNTFRKICRKEEIDVVFKSALTHEGHNKEQLRHYQLATQVIFESAKFQWLAPWRNKTTVGYQTCVKRQVGGLYLLQLLACHQLTRDPEPLYKEIQQIRIELRDIKAIGIFFQDVRKIINEKTVYVVPLLRSNIPKVKNGALVQEQIFSAFELLKTNKLLQYTVESSDYTLDAATIYLMEMKKNHQIVHLMTLKDVRDKMLFATFQGIGNSIFKDLLTCGHALNKQSQSSECHMDTSGQRTNKFPLEKKTKWTPDDIEELMKERDLAVIAFRLVEIFKYLTPPNVMTEERLTFSKNFKRRIAKTVSEIQEQNRIKHSYRANRPKGNHKQRDSSFNFQWKKYLSSPGMDLKDADPSQVTEVVRASDNQYKATSSYDRFSHTNDFEDKPRNSASLLRPSPVMDTISDTSDDDDSGWELEDSSASEELSLDEEEPTGKKIMKNPSPQSSNDVLAIQTTVTTHSKTSQNISWLNMPTLDCIFGGADFSSKQSAATISKPVNSIEEKLCGSDEIKPNPKLLHTSMTTDSDSDSSDDQMKTDVHCNASEAMRISTSEDEKLAQNNEDIVEELEVEPLPAKVGFLEEFLELYKRRQKVLAKQGVCNTELKKVVDKQAETTANPHNMENVALPHEDAVMKVDPAAASNLSIARRSNRIRKPTVKHMDYKL